MNKVLLIQPPQWYPVSPYLAVPLLTAQLKKSGFEAKAFDLNVKFYNRILSKEHLIQSDKKARELLNELSVKFKNADVSELEKNAGYRKKTEYLKYASIKKFYEENADEIEKIIEKIQWAVNTMKSEENFYIPEKLFKAKHIIRLALRLASMPFSPNEIDIDNYFANPLFALDWENIKNQCEDKSLNMFFDYFEVFVSEISKENYDVISISMTDLSQLIPVFTLTKMLKSKTNAKIALGGNYATQIYEDMMKYDEIFTSYIDYLLIGDGEIAICKLCEHICSGCDISEVPNVVYFNGTKTVGTGFSCEKITMDNLEYADFSDYDFSDYFSPDPTFPIQLSKGCYWGKCSFCDYAYGQQGYSPKRIGSIINELKYYIGKYNASKFIFVDEAIPPKFYNELAKAIVAAGLKINFYSFARLENGYTPEVLKNLYDAGARLFLWGYECEEPRIMKLMNKGIDVENRMKILTDAREAGIWNNGLFIFGYPTETIEETRKTMDIIRNNRRIIPSCTLSNFSLKKHSILKESIGENGIISYSSGGEFYTVYKDVADGISQADRRSLRRDFQFAFLEENKNSLWPVVFSDFDHLLLYLSKFGCDYVNSYRSKEKICPEFR